MWNIYKGWMLNYWNYGCALEYLPVLSPCVCVYVCVRINVNDNEWH